MGSALFHQDLLTCPAQTDSPNKPVPLETGAPFFPVPSFLEQCLSEPGTYDEWTEYPPLHGLPQLKEAIARFHVNQFGIPHKAENILVTYGAMQACFDYLTCELDAGDEILLPAPYWFQFPQIIKYTQAKLSLIHTKPKNGFKLTPELLERHITPRTRLLIITNPNNPTGSVFTRQELEDLAEVLVRHPKIKVLSDEAYNMLTFNGEPCMGPAGVKAIQDRVMVVNSMSKNFGLAGLRIGYIAGPVPIIERLGQRQRFATLGVNPRLQHVACRVMEQREAVTANLLKEVMKRRDRAQELMRHLPLLTFSTPESGYYFYANAKPYMGCRSPEGEMIEDDEALADYLLRKAGVSVMPSSWCGAKGYLRLTFAVEPDQFEKAVLAMAKNLRGLTRDRQTH